MKFATREIVRNAAAAGIVVPAFNIPHLPIMAPVVQALRDTGAFGLIQVARLEWMKFKSGSMKAVSDEYEKCKDENFTRLHLDHVPVIDEDNLRVDFAAILQEAVDLGYESIMVDGSRLPLDENIACAATAVRIAAKTGVPVEGELGAVLGHESGPLPPYEELFVSGRGFTDPLEAAKMVAESGLDWLSVAIGNIHGAISGAAKTQKKVAAKLNIEHLLKIRQAVGNIPLVLHGGSGIEREYLQQSFRNGIAKINVGTTLRQAYEEFMHESAEKAQAAVYQATCFVINEDLRIAGSAAKLLKNQQGQ